MQDDRDDRNGNDHDDCGMRGGILKRTHDNGGTMTDACMLQ